LLPVESLGFRRPKSSKKLERNPWNHPAVLFGEGGAKESANLFEVENLAFLLSHGCPDARARVHANPSPGAFNAPGKEPGERALFVVLRNLGNRPAVDMVVDPVPIDLPKGNVPQRPDQLPEGMAKAGLRLGSKAGVTFQPLQEGNLRVVEARGMVRANGVPSALDPVPAPPKHFLRFRLVAKEGEGRFSRAKLGRGKAGHLRDFNLPGCAIFGFELKRPALRLLNGGVVLANPGTLPSVPIDLENLLP
jgi:hypothetical protein